MAMRNPWLAALILLFVANLAAAGEINPEHETLRRPWTQFLGPDRNGISQETGLIQKWPEGGPRELWRVPLGVGMAGVVGGDEVHTLAHREGKQCFVTFDAETGKTIGEIPIAPIYRNAMGDGPRATPTVSGHEAWVYTGEGILAYIDRSEKKVVWQHDVPTELGGKPAEYGMASSPLLDETRIVVIAGAPGASVVAYESRTGKLAWKSGDDPCGYSSPVILKAGGRTQIVALTGSSVLGLDRETGKQLWRYPFVTEYNCNTANPIAVDDKVFVSAGENHGSVLLDVSGDRPKVVWESVGPKSVLRSEWQTPIRYGDHLYNFDNVGSAGAISHFTCIEAKTGQRVWQQPRFGKGNAIYADGLLLMSMFDGQFVAARPSAKGYEELGRMKVVARTRQAPSLIDGRLYLRDDRELVCIDLRRAK